MNMENSLRVVKFGGTSMGSAEAMRQAARIVGNYAGPRLVVVSATSGTTNQLLQAYRERASGMAATETLAAIRSRHEELAARLEARAHVTEELARLDQELTSAAAAVSGEDDRALDFLLSFGERLSSVIFAEALAQAGARSAVVDARGLLRTDARFGKADPDTSASKALCQEKLRPRLEAGEVLVTQGFIGATADGETTTLGRGGSDYSAALFAEALGAESCWIWTDVNGIYSMDPRVVPNARVIREISFGEAAELANFGAKVLHPATLLPAVRAGIRVFVGNTFKPEEGGTWIHAELTERPLLRAIATRERQTLITVNSMRMLNTHGYLAKLFTILANHGLSIDLVTTSEVSVALTVDGTSAGSSGKSILDNHSLMAELSEIAEVKVEENLSLVALVGNRLSSTPGVAARTFQAVGLDNVRLICHGASPNNLCFLVNSSEVRRVASRLHEAFL
jgi:aspartate kinase